MNTRKIVAEYHLSQWAQFVNEYKESGLTVKAFCQNAGIHPNVYYYRQRKLREAACLKLAVQAEPNDSKAAVPNGWAICEPAINTALTVAESTSSISVEIGSFRIAVDNDFDTELFTKVCKALVAVC